ncbi:MAG TPA: thioredoxin [Moorella mulderi]|nr:thioredoxin [Moorella mulderi]
MASIIELTEENFSREVLQDPGLVLVDFWAAWCGPCRMFAPVVDSIAQEYEGKVKVAKLNVDDHPSIAERYNIMSIPTVILFKQGEKVAQLIGYQTKDRLAQVIERYL